MVMLMVRYKLLLSETAAEEDYPLESVDVAIDVDVQVVDGVPDAASRKLAISALRRIAQQLEGEDLEGDTDGRPLITTPRPPRPPSLNHDDDWVRPAGIDMRIVKSAHKLVQEVAKRGENGRAVLASELIQEGLVSAPTMSRMLRNDETAGQYLEPFVTITDAGRTKAIDLTAKGRLLASKIRAGTIPT